MTLADNALERQAGLFEIWFRAIQPSKPGTTVRYDRGQWLIEFVCD
jgi:hypothetical protein